VVAEEKSSESTQSQSQSQSQTKQPKRDRWWVLATIALVLWVAIRLAFEGLDAWPEAVVGGVIYAGGMTWWSLRRRRNDAGSIGVEPTAVNRLDRRIMKEDIPDDPAERQAMARLAERRRVKLTRGRWWAFPLLTVMFLAGAAVWFSLGEYLQGGLITAFGVVFLGFVMWMNRRALRRIDRVEHRLGTTSP